MKKEGLRDKLFNNDIDIRQRLFVLNVLVTEIILGVDLIEVFLLDDILYSITFVCRLKTCASFSIIEHGIIKR